MPDTDNSTYVKKYRNSQLYFLGTLLGLLIIETQLENMGIYPPAPVLKVSAISILLLCAGIAISITSHLFMMRARFGIWCFIPPEFRKSLCDHSEPLTRKIMVISLLIQYFAAVPVFMYSVTQIHPATSFGMSINMAAIFLIWLALLLCGRTVFSHFYGKLKK